MQTEKIEPEVDEDVEEKSLAEKVRDLDTLKHNARQLLIRVGTAGEKIACNKALIKMAVKYPGLKVPKKRK